MVFIANVGWGERCCDRRDARFIASRQTLLYPSVSLGGSGPSRRGRCGESGDSPSSQITWGWKRSRALGTAKAEFSLTKDLSADALLSHTRRDPWAFTVPWEGVWRVGNFSPGSSTSVLLKPHCPMVFVRVCQRTLFYFCCSLSG